MRGAFDYRNHVSAFPPIGDYAFLSDCQTTALVAPNGNVEWLCLPRMDSPSVFAALLDRDAGGFRVAPADVNVPAARRYIPGTMVLETTWETRMGWVIVRDALSIGPWHHDTERSRSYRRSPTDHDADHVLLRLIECVEGSVEIKVDCEPAFDYGGLAADWSYGGSGYTEAFAPFGGHRYGAAARHRPQARVRGAPGTRAGRIARGRGCIRSARMVRAPTPEQLRGGGGVAGAHGALLAGVAEARQLPGSPVALVPSAQRADAQGPHLHPVGGDGRRGHHVAAGDARRRSQLGLPLQLDPRLDVHAVGALHARLRRRGG